MNTRSFASLLLLVVAISAVAVRGFQQQPLPLAQSRSQSQESSSTAVFGIFDMVKKSMESGYAGGDDSPYSKIKAQDDKREAIRKQRAEERKKRGYTELKDVKEKTFVKLKYGDKKGAKPEAPPKEEKKKLFGMF